MTETEVLDAAKRQLDMMDKFGLQARRELSDEQVKELCRLVLHKQEHIEALVGRVHALEEQLKTARQQRDSANGKLSALRREQNNGDS